eukprot:453204-Prymnesium_polylepis.1
MGPTPKCGHTHAGGSSGRRTASGLRGHEEGGCEPTRDGVSTVTHTAHSHGSDRSAGTGTGVPYTPASHSFIPFMVRPFGVCASHGGAHGVRARRSPRRLGASSALGRT